MIFFWEEVLQNAATGDGAGDWCTVKVWKKLSLENACAIMLHTHFFKV